MAATIIEMTQPMPRSTGLRIVYKLRAMIEPMKIANILTTFFIWLNPGVDVKPRFADMLLFVLIVLTFFYLYITFGFSLLDT